MVRSVVFRKPRGLLLEGASLPHMILSSENVEGGSNLGKILDVGPKEVAHAQELLDFLYGGLWWGLSQGFEVVFTGRNDFWCEMESYEGEFGAYNVTFGKINLELMVLESLKESMEVVQMFSVGARIDKDLIHVNKFVG